ncbi:MAG: PhzF family phenazine biosynthesis protein [Deltaproteobacteria bacterium]|nr:PhzF family phenazine biosynthesis protein [Deltaproteobacteria bacterium]
MDTRRFRIVNVFTVDGDRLSGNPLCVFEDARGLSSEQMQALARQFNLSETTFVLPSERATAHVRIFTPGFEMPFAGHPTLGTAHVVRALRGGDRVTFEMKAGIVPVTSRGDTWTLQAAKAPLTKPVAASRAELARMVGLPDDAVCDEPLWVNTGAEQLVIPIRSAELVRAARPVPELVIKHGFSDARDEAMAYLWAPDGTVRFFFTQHGAVIEDPATGSACANLGGWFLARGHQLPLQLKLRQGEAVHRPSRLELNVDEQRRVFVTGSVIELGSGSLTL